MTTKRGRNTAQTSPVGMSQEDGCIRVMQTCYSADHYFQRLDAQFLDENFKFTLHELRYWERHHWAWVKRCFFNYVKFAAVASRLLRLEDGVLRSRYRRQLLGVLRARWREPHILFIYALKVSFHYHFAAIARALQNVGETGGVMPTAGRPFSRVKRVAKRKRPLRRRHWRKRFPLPFRAAARKHHAPQPLYRPRRIGPSSYGAFVSAKDVDKLSTHCWRFRLRPVRLGDCRYWSLGNPGRSSNASTRSRSSASRSHE
jgi:hypothetical protein